MARRVFKSDLSVNGIGDLISQLEYYKRDLTARNTLFVERLADVGIPIIDMKIAQAQGDSDKDYETDITVVNSMDVVTATITLSGRDILFIEFPTGIYYNNAVHHPKATEFGYGVGTYRKDETGRDSRGLNPGFWWYKDDSGNLHYSIGTECTMPMYSASLEIIREIERIAREVFENG